MSKSIFHTSFNHFLIFSLLVKAETETGKHQVIITPYSLVSIFVFAYTLLKFS